MDLQETKALLEKCTRQELRDHSFGDTEVYWTQNGKEVAGGYFSASEATVWFSTESVIDETNFHDDEARELRKCGTLQVSRNDETGPDEYQEGVTMPGLTLEGVRKELTGAQEENRG